MIRSLDNALQPLYNAASEESPLRRVASLPKVIFLIVFLILTISFGRYDWIGSALFALVPLVLARAGGMSPLRLLSRMSAAWPFVLCAGIANCFFDRAPVEILSGTTAPGGFISLVVLIGKTTAAIGMTLLLAATTPMDEITKALATLRVPRILILQLQFTFRYLGVLVDEARNAVNAYRLRNPRCRRIPFRDWGILVGRLFLRTLQRADAIHAAMQCRLFRLDSPLPPGKRTRPSEWLGTLLAVTVLIIARYLL